MDEYEIKVRIARIKLFDLSVEAETENDARKKAIKEARELEEWAYDSIADEAVIIKAKKKGGKNETD